ncbi:CLIP domain-containing serine protease B9-like [Drosophila albomicans]|uniref:CLIP domain-containing serine protease B9-like n=1 Tax=Drosophila albomicans TaxID=7291 RepID=A0A6P8ZC24_DROAB|nr:CLIP domain-containing serine protease B9-like [Drosophila albomicans]
MRLSATQIWQLLLLVVNLKQVVLAQDEPNCGYLKEASFANRSNVVDLNEHPWIARVGYETDRGIAYKCLAILITRQHLLAPAQCFNEVALKAEPVRWVLLGDWNPTNPFVERDCDARQNCNQEPLLMAIDEIIIHPNYDERMLANNLSILKLIQPVTFSNFISPICLHARKTITYSGQYFIYAGFAVDENIGYKLKAVTQLQETMRCRETLMRQNYVRAALAFTVNPLCGNSNQTTPLVSGSPLMGVNVESAKPQSYYLAGLLQTMTNQNNSLIFIRVQPHIEWIEKSTRIETSTLPTIIPAHLVRYEKHSTRIVNAK